MCYTNVKITPLSGSLAEYSLSFDDEEMGKHFFYSRVRFYELIDRSGENDYEMLSGGRLLSRHSLHIGSLQFAFSCDEEGCYVRCSDITKKEENIMLQQYKIHEDGGSVTWAFLVPGVGLNDLRAERGSDTVKVSFYLPDFDEKRSLQTSDEDVKTLMFVDDAVFTLEDLAIDCENGILRVTQKKKNPFKQGPIAEFKKGGE